MASSSSISSKSTRFGKALTTLVIVTACLVMTWGTFVYAHGSLTFLGCRLLFNHYLSQESRELDTEAQSGLSSTYYFTSYSLNGILSAVEGTGNERLLRRTIRYLDTMMAKAEEFEDNGQRYLAWRPFAITPDSLVAGPNLHFTFQATVPFARTAAIIRSNPRFRERYGDAAQRYVAFVDRVIIQYWFKRRLKGEIPWINPDAFPLWNDNGSNLALNATYLCIATGDPLYCGMARQIGETFKSKLSPIGQAWIWESQTIPIGSDTDNTPGSVGNQAGVPDTSHANREAMLVVSQHEAGLLFSLDDIQHMAHTFTDVIWNGSSTNPMFANYINGSDKAYRVYKEPGLNGSIYHGWALVGGYSPEAQKVLLYTLKAILFSNQTNGALERNATSYGGKLGLCGHILRNFAVAASLQPQTGSIYRRMESWPRIVGPETGVAR